MIKSKGLGKKYRKATVTLEEGQENFIDDVRRRIKKSGGFSLARTEIVRTAIDLLRYLKVNSMDLSGIKHEEDLLEKIKMRVAVKP